MISSIQARILLSCASVLALSLAGCTDDRNATTRGELFHCSSGADCLEGWSCQCGYCQEPGVVQLACGVQTDANGGDGQISGGDATTDDSGLGDSTNADVAGDTPSVDTQSTDTLTPDAAPSDAGALTPDASLGICGQTVSSDVVAGPCDLVDWSGCPDTSYACYYAPALQTSICKKHATFAENGACEPCNLSECGEATGGRKLICDAVDKKCYRTCNWQQLNAFPCPSGWTCYKLTDNQQKVYPDGAGICAP